MPHRGLGRSDRNEGRLDAHAAGLRDDRGARACRDRPGDRRPALRPIRRRRPRPTHPQPRTATDDPPALRPVTERDLRIVSAQLGRRPRDVVGIAARCVCGKPTVVATAPRLADGTPFPTFYYLSHPAATAAMSALEATQVMASAPSCSPPTPTCAPPIARAHGALPRRPRAVRRGRRDRRHLGRRHADPRQVPARARRALARGGPRREPDRRPRARALVVVARPSASAPITVSTTRSRRRSARHPKS